MQCAYSALARTPKEGAMHLQEPEAIEKAGWNFSVQSAPETILFVEDESLVRDVIGEVLRTAGYAVLTARNATEALLAYGEHPSEIDLLLTDVILPGETGRILAKRLRLQDQQLKVLFVTGYAEQMHILEAERTECLAKPFSSEILLLTVRELLDRHPARREETRRGEPQLVKHAAGSA
jgi:two-component system cell cycle sensor histidine kinase/response regulator CckA